MIVAELATTFQQRAGAQALLKEQADAAGARAQAEEARAADIDQVVALLGAVHDQRRDVFQTEMGSIVGHGLTAVFQEELHLIVEMGMQGVLPTSEFSIYNPALDLKTPIAEARGGGLLAIVAFLLKIRLLLAMRPMLARFLAADEPFAAMDAGKIPRMAALIRRIAEEGGYQFLLVTHHPPLAEAGDVAYELSQTAGVTHMRPMTAGMVPVEMPQTA